MPSKCMAMIFEVAWGVLLVFFFFPIICVVVASPTASEATI